jgi:hypothetical protein
MYSSSNVLNVRGQKGNIREFTLSCTLKRDNVGDNEREVSSQRISEIT